MFDKGKVITLTPRLFREIDILSRKNAGRPVEVLDYREIPGDFGHLNFMGSDVVCLDSRKEFGPGNIKEMGLIKIVNQINLMAFKSVFRPEMDYGKVPWESIYYFVVWHEIGHRLFDSHELLWPEGVFTDPKLRKLFYWAMEARADRFAWGKISSKSFPKVRDSRPEMKDVNEVIKSYPEYFSGKPRFVPEEISTEPYEYVPMSYAKKGIPWAGMMARAKNEEVQGEQAKV